MQFSSYKIFLKFGRSGFTLIEILIVISIIVVLLAISTSSFTNINKAESLKADVRNIISVIDEARGKTLSSKNSSQYGVHFEEFNTTLFTGAIYSSGNPTNQVTGLGSLTHISSISLNGGGSDVIFDRLTGATSQSGTITVTLKDSSDSKNISISSTGIIESQ